jgi:hypothetical protein
MKMTNKKELFETIQFAIQEIEYELRALDKGIFFAPELYIAFKIGLNIYKNRKSIFFGKNAKWLRETSFAKGTIADIAFEVDGTKCVFELKIRSTGSSYESDIKKLQALKDINEKYFIALVDCFDEGEDGRIPILDTLSAPERHYKSIIETNYFINYKKPLHCELHILEV